MSMERWDCHVESVGTLRKVLMSPGRWHYLWEAPRACAAAVRVVLSLSLGGVSVPMCPTTPVSPQQWGLHPLRGMTRAMLWWRQGHQGHRGWGSVGPGTAGSSQLCPR